MEQFYGNCNCNVVALEIEMLSEINTLVMDWSTFVVEMLRYGFYVCGIKKCFILFCGLVFILSLASQMQGDILIWNDI